MAGISTILWDVGGVLLTNGFDGAQRDAMLKQFALDHDAFELRHAEVFPAWEKDTIGVDEYLRHVVFYEPRDFTPAQFLEAMKQQSQVLPDSGLRILSELAASQQYVLATVNNESRVLNEYRVARFGLADSFQAFFSSCYLGLRKPDPKIYQVALDVLQRDPEDTAFIDDRAENVAAAAKLGIQAIHYTGSEELAQELERLGIGARSKMLREA